MTLPQLRLLRLELCDIGTSKTSETSQLCVETRQMSVLATEKMSAVETGQMSSVETGQMSAVETGQMSSVLSQQKACVLSQWQTSKPGLRRPRQRPTKAMTVNPWPAEAATAAD